MKVLLQWKYIDRIILLCVVIELDMFIRQPVSDRGGGKLYAFQNVLIS